MSCEQYAGAIVDHAFGADIAPDARTHLEACAACRGRFDDERRAMQSLDAELQQALAIEPSAHFDRAVRARIERTSSARPRTIWWTALAAAAAVLIVIGVWAIRSNGRAAVVPAEDVARGAAPSAPAPAAVQPSVPEIVPPDKAGTPKRRGGAPPHQLAQRRGSSSPAVEVIVAPDQAHAIERYLALVRSGTLDTSNLAPQTESRGEPPALVVAPLRVEELTVPDAEIAAGPSIERRGR